MPLQEERSNELCFGRGRSFVTGPCFSETRRHCDETAVSVDFMRRVNWPYSWTRRNSARLRGVVLHYGLKSLIVVADEHYEVFARAAYGRECATKNRFIA